MRIRPLDKFWSESDALEKCGSRSVYFVRLLRKYFLMKVYEKKINLGNTGLLQQSTHNLSHWYFIKFTIFYNGNVCRPNLVFKKTPFNVSIKCLYSAGGNLGLTKKYFDPKARVLTYFVIRQKLIFTLYSRTSTASSVFLIQKSKSSMNQI